MQEKNQEIGYNTPIVQLWGDPGRKAENRKPARRPRKEGIR
jgi:hypothetical protein